MTDDWRRWLPDLASGLVVLGLGGWEIHRELENQSIRGPVWTSAAVVAGLVLAVGLSRAQPGLALMLAWLTGGFQIMTGTGAMVVELLFAIVAFGCARWGSTAVVWLSGLSIPIGAAIAVLWLDPNVFYDALDVAGVRVLAQNAYRGGNDWRLMAALLAMTVLAAPWLAGLALRFGSRAQASRVSQLAAEQDAARAQVESEQAREIAQLRAEQARLARDVHDVVGHSLAVILAQAESAQYLPDTDPEALKKTLATIATSARTSLQDVRQVLSSPQHPAPARTDAFEQLVDGVRAGGTEVVATEVGVPQPLPPELEVVAHRVVQEMLTNAIKHGRRDQPVHVERHWPEGAFDRDLRIEVRNVEDDTGGRPIDETQPVNAVEVIPGQGLEGMQRRLDSVGGRLDVRRRVQPDGPTFTATAWVPVRAAR